MANFARQTLSSVDAWMKPADEKQEKAELVKPVVKKVGAKKVVPVEKVKTKAKPTKSATKPKLRKDKHLDASTIEDDGLPTLNKVLEAYAKTTGPRGKVGEIN
jgi:hypothetical protein